MRQHTQGKWVAQQGINQMVNDGTTICFRDGWGVFTDADTHGDSEADAHLIAAAPELLEALKCAEKSMAATHHPDCANDPDGPLFKVRAAIAKAEGGA